ncbi:MAG: GNAT family N-acetyltransferase [Steroidobacteraceae bacterium]
MTDSPATVQFQPYKGLSGLEQLLPEWLELLQSMPDARFIHYPEWYRAYLKSLAPDRSRVWFVAARRDGRLVGILPLEFRVFTLGAFRAPVVGTIDDDQMQLSDFIFTRCEENADLLYRLTQWLRQQPGPRWSELRLRKVAADSCLAYSAGHKLPSWTLTVQHARSNYFLTDKPYDEAMAALSAKFRSNLRRRNRIAEESAPLRLAIYSEPNDLAEGFRHFLDLEASGWKGVGGTSSAINCQPRLLEFYETLVQQFGRGGHCAINVLWHGDQPVAGQLCVRIGRTLNILKVGFSEAHAKFAPGLLLLERVTRNACEDPDTDVVHLVNDPSWATFFRPLGHGVRSYCAPAWSLGGLCVHLGLLAKRKWGHVQSDGSDADFTASKPGREPHQGPSLEA